MYTVPVVVDVFAVANADGNVHVVDVPTPVAIFVHDELFRLYCRVWVNALEALGVLMVTVLPTFQVPLTVGVVARGIVSSVAVPDPLAGARTVPKYVPDRVTSKSKAQDMATDLEPSEPWAMVTVFANSDFFWLPERDASPLAVFV